MGKKTKITVLNLKIVLLVAFFVVIAAVVIIFLIQSNLNKPVAKVNGEAVEREEYQLFLNKDRASIYNYFYQTYGAENSKTFWTTDFKGETPENTLRQKALKDVVQIKVQQCLAKQMGVVQDVSYKTFLKKLNQENIRRMDVLHKNGVIYGTQQYDEKGYYDYVFNNMVISLQNKLSQSTLQISDEKLKDYYDTVKDKLYKLPDSIKINWVYSPLSEDKKNLLEQEFKITKTEIMDGKSFNEIKNKNENNNKLGIIFKERVINQDSAKSDAVLEPILSEKANGIKSGETSEIFEENGNLNLISLVSRTNGGYQKFDDVKDNVRKSYVSKKYDSYINELVKKAVIDVDKAVLNRIKIQ